MGIFQQFFSGKPNGQLRKYTEGNYKKQEASDDLHGSVNTLQQNTYSENPAYSFFSRV